MRCFSCLLSSASFLHPTDGRSGGGIGQVLTCQPILTHHKTLDLELEKIVGSAGWEKDIRPERISVEKVRRSKKELYELEVHSFVCGFKCETLVKRVF